MKMKRLEAGSFFRSPDGLHSTVMPVSRDSPSTSTTLVRGHTSMFGVFSDLLDQVVRHGSASETHAPGITTFSAKLREMHSGLPGGIRAANDIHGFALAANASDVPPP